MTVSNYHLSLLITGGTTEERYTYTQKIANDHAIHASDKIELVSTSTIGIDHVRQWIKRLSYKPISSDQKIGIIHPGELLSIEAQQSLLKTLEEPPKQTIIVITAPFAGALLPTIQSRCIEHSLKESMAKEMKLDSNELIEVLEGDNSRRLELAETYGSADQAEPYINKLRIALHHMLFNDSIDKLAIFPIYGHLENAQKALKVNVHPRLVIENLLLSLPKLGSRT